ncbi:MAG: dephospho-CoA kinase [Butyrivibrio sp.]|uniref:dephospho-CoA kinase n=1 Tax=Butyrivibrio sp. TaxID=28121 RepID=UPI0025F6A169|nr:dephospho-CoA kinase [Butyrivibrio sp.]MCR5771220.1 dephospho-CoA kinase [Butyrivibrio sp.]
MKLIGVTGGVGAGKSALLTEVLNKYNCKVVFSDNVANDVKKKGMPAYDKLVELLGKEILLIETDGSLGEIDKKKMAQAIFKDDELLQKVNDILHPATNDYIKDVIANERAKNEIDYLFVEAALLIENGYKDIVDELWYIYASEEVRRLRLKEARGYSDEKIDNILEAQLSEEEFRRNCDFVVDNSSSIEAALKQIDEHLSSKKS